MKEAHLSDGAIAALREDLAEAEPRVPAVLAWGYVSKALDEIEWLRSRELELEARVAVLDWLVAEWQAAPRIGVDTDGVTPAMAVKHWDAMETRVKELESAIIRAWPKFINLTCEYPDKSGTMDSLFGMVPEPISECPCDECEPAQDKVADQ